MSRFLRYTIFVLAVAATPMAAPLGSSEPSAPLDQAASAAPAAVTSQDRQLPKANYDLASQWTGTKVGKYVFSTSVTPHWLEPLTYSHGLVAAGPAIPGRATARDFALCVRLRLFIIHENNTFR